MGCDGVTEHSYLWHFHLYDVARLEGRGYAGSSRVDHIPSFQRDELGAISNQRGDVKYEVGGAFVLYLLAIYTSFHPNVVGVYVVLRGGAAVFS